MPFSRSKKRASRKKQAYNAYVRRRGKFKKVNKKKLTRNQAYNRAAGLVDRTVAATFKIKKAKGRIKSPFFDTKNPKFQGKFRKKNTLFVEKNKHRIDTFGEKRGLTLAKALRQEKKGGGFQFRL